MVKLKSMIKEINLTPSKDIPVELKKIANELDKNRFEYMITDDGITIEYGQGILLVSPFTNAANSYKIVNIDDYPSTEVVEVVLSGPLVVPFLKDYAERNG